MSPSSALSKSGDAKSVGDWLSSPASATTTGVASGESSFSASYTFGLNISVLNVGYIDKCVIFLV